MADIVLISPKFNISFWGMQEAMRFIGKRANFPNPAMPLLAALTPAEHQVTIIDENVEPIDFERCARADIVGVTGMIVQRARMREVLQELRRRGCYTVVGGPWISVSENYFGDLVDVAFIGEAEETWPRFLEDWKQGKAQARYEQAEKTDLSRVPPPRLDLVRMRRYAFGSIQFTRGCPFTCEFCDIIVIFGRRPRLKTAAQIVRELDDLKKYNLPMVFIVDDNLIGNKKAIKEVLKHVIEWQRQNAYPFTFTTEASIDLADDPELMRLMVEANISTVFVGIESTSEEALRETKKLQNIRPNGTLVEKIGRIQAAGMTVMAGMIVGFDSDDTSVFTNHRKFAQAARIPIISLGMLTAVPKTPLYTRIAAAGRLDPCDESAFGTNIMPLQMSRQELSDGYAQLMTDLYEPKAYFERLDGLFIDGNVQHDRGWLDYASRHAWRRRSRHARFWFEAFALMGRMMILARDRGLRNLYLRHFWRCLRARPVSVIARAYALQCAIHYHLHQNARAARTYEGAVINGF